MKKHSKMKKFLICLLPVVCLIPLGLLFLYNDNNYKNTYKNLKTKYDSIAHENDVLKTTNIGLKSKIKELQVNNKSEESDKLNTQNKELQEKVDALQKENADLQIQINTLTDNSTNLNSNN